MDIYEKCPQLENENLFIRLIESEDAQDLLEVYGDKFALPFSTATTAMAATFTAGTWRIWKTR